MHPGTRYVVTEVELLKTISQMSTADGGGVKGLSSLYILRGIMIEVNEERTKAGRSAVKPCDIFDLICGTSTGG